MSKNSKPPKTFSKQSGILQYNSSREPFSHTPSWLSPEETARLKARISRLKSKEKQWRMKKEDVILVQALPSENDPDDQDNKTSTADTDSLAEEKKATQDANPVEDSMVAERNKQTNQPGGSSEKENSETALKREESDKTKKNKPLEKNQNKDSTKDHKTDENPPPMLPKDPRSIPSGNVVITQEERKIAKTRLSEHIWASNYKEFDPKLYHFKSPEKLSTKSPVLADCPPYWVLLDHTIAVIWKLFCPAADRKQLAIIPLQWSREFVSAMKNDHGEYLPAINQVLSAIEDSLIDRYAKAFNKTADQNIEEASNKDDIVPETSSDSIVINQIEVSYTLRDIMSRNLPGRKAVDFEESGVKCKADPALKKADVPSFKDENMKIDDMLMYLKQLKQEQDVRVAKEKEHAEKIEAMMELMKNGAVDSNALFEPQGQKKKPHDNMKLDSTSNDNDNRKTKTPPAADKDSANRKTKTPSAANKDNDNLNPKTPPAADKDKDNRNSKTPPPADDDNDNRNSKTPPPADKDNENEEINETD